jgi:predicted glycoside hydrolase/deacetylase ChbG (UPF0249 family)
MRCLIAVVAMVALHVAPCASEAKDSPAAIELCVRGDDMGHSLDVNLAFIQAHTEGILTSASLMPPAPYFDDAVGRCRLRPKLAVGVHVTLMAAIPMRPVLPPDEVPSLVAPDGYFHRGLDDFLKAQPKLAEVEKEMRAQIKKCQATGLRFVYLDWHIASQGGTKRPDIAELYPRLAREYRLLLAQDPDGRYTGAKYVPAGLETWGSQRLPDGTLVYYAGPDMPDAVRTKFLYTLEQLQPGTWYTVCHPGLYARRQAQSVAVICSPEVKNILQAKNVRLVSFQDLWERKYGK